MQAAPEWLLLRPSPEPSTPHPLTPSSARGDNEPATRPPFGGDGGQRFHRGRVLHRLLQILPGLPAERRAAAARAFLARPVLGLAREAQAEIQAEVLAVLNQPDAKTLFGEDSRAEVPITGQLGRAIITGQIDRLAVLADRVVLADYKTNREPPADAGLTPAIYLRQMALYRALLGRIYPDKSIYCYIVWTFGPRLVHLEADLLDRHLPVEARFLDAAAGASLDSG
ncbi:MAG: hypothetical protein FJX52_07340 [Alphaproteobacteria bacterium]|nr:hypothetical protein [Alphaproteobacteria bacterium]